MNSDTQNTALSTDVQLSYTLTLVEIDYSCSMRSWIMCGDVVVKNCRMQTHEPKYCYK